MFKALVPLALVLTAGGAIACPGAEKARDAKVDTPVTTPVAAALSAATQQTKADAEKKVAKAGEPRKPKS